jgi:predicted O-methyltransferase YrrM
MWSVAKGLWSVAAGLAYWITANSRHAVHSPFVYALIERVLRDGRVPPTLHPVLKARQALSKRTDIVHVTDLGAGSHMQRREARSIARVLSTSSTNARTGLALLRLAEYMQAEYIVELGTCLGMGTLHLAHASTAKEVHTVEGCPQLQVLAKEQFQAFRTLNIIPHLGAFVSVLPKVLQDLPRLDLFFLDGHHQQDALLRYFSMALPKAHERSVFVVHDIRWSPGMCRAWQQIRAQERVTLSVDLGTMGLVFFLPGRAKQHFRLRFLSL